MRKKIFFYYFITGIIFLLIFCFVNCNQNSVTEDLLVNLSGQNDISISEKPTLLFNKNVYSKIDQSADIILYNFKSSLNTLTIRVKSNLDLSGIELDLTKNGDNYVGSLLFDDATSIDQLQIEVTDDSTIIAEFNDDALYLPLQHVVRWYDSIYFGLYSTLDTYATNFRFGATENQELYRGIFSQTGNITTNTELTDVTDDYKYKHIVMSDASLWQVFEKNENLSAFTNGVIHFKIKSEYNLLVKIEWLGGYDEVYLEDYMDLTDDWQDVLIPLSDFEGIDLSTIRVLYGFHYWGSGVADFYFYDLYLEK